MKNNKIYLISLGCAKNQVDSEHILGILKFEGYKPVTEIEEADVAVINTCGFLQSSIEEAIDTILEVIDLKAKGQLLKVIVAGCFVQRYGYKLKKEIPEVDGWIGTGEVHRIAELLVKTTMAKDAPFYINRPVNLLGNETPRVQTTPFFSSYLRIAEGCSHKCSYCIIPNLRGPFRSKNLESLIKEAKTMVDNGVKEINLIAQDISMYGKDLNNNYNLEILLEKLIKIKELKWIRLLYCHPDGVSDRLLEIIDSEEKICPYLDLPLQHVNKNILTAMGRDVSRETPQKLIERIQKIKRKISIRTTFIVGFPGETDCEFNELYDFIKKTRFDHLGVFTYSREKGTKAARLDRIVDSKIALIRKNSIMDLQADISQELNQKFIGKTISVLIEGPSPETDLLLKGRSATMAPDVDTQILINKGNAIIGDIMPVIITEVYPYDLIGEIADNED